MSRGKPRARTKIWDNVQNLVAGMGGSNKGGQRKTVPEKEKEKEEDPEKSTKIPEKEKEKEEDPEKSGKSLPEKKEEKEKEEYYP